MASSKTAQRDRLDRLFSRIVRNRAKGQCQCCKDSTPYDDLECAHIFRRGYLATRWDLDNALGLCHDCHQFFTDRPNDFEIFILNLKGESAYGVLRFKANQRATADLSEIEAELKRIAAHQDTIGVGQ